MQVDPGWSDGLEQCQSFIQHSGSHQWTSL